MGRDRVDGENVDEAAYPHSVEDHTALTGDAHKVASNQIRAIL